MSHHARRSRIPPRTMLRSRSPRLEARRASRASPSSLSNSVTPGSRREGSQRENGSRHGDGGYEEEQEGSRGQRGAWQHASHARKPGQTTLLSQTREPVSCVPCFVYVCARLRGSGADLRCDIENSVCGARRRLGPGAAQHSLTHDAQRASRTTCACVSVCVIVQSAM